MTKKERKKIMAKLISYNTKKLKGKQDMELLANKCDKLCAKIKSSRAEFMLGMVGNAPKMKKNPEAFIIFNTPAMWVSVDWKNFKT